MARTTRQYRAEIDFRKVGKFERPRIREAIAKAQKENAALLERHVKFRARARMKPQQARHTGGSRPRGKSMINSYRARVIEGGRTVSLTNPSPKAKWFEEGTRRHRIVAPPGKVLSWKGQGQGGVWIFRARVMHPGQKATWVMAETVRLLSRVMGRNIDEKIQREA